MYNPKEDFSIFPSCFARNLFTIYSYACELINTIQMQRWPSKSK